MIKKMKRLGNNTSKRMHREVELRVVNGDNNRSKIEQANMTFVIAKRIIADLPLVPTNDLIYSIVDDIQVGLYDDLGSIENADKNWSKWLERTKYILQAQGRLLMYDNNIRKPILTIRGEK